MEARQHLEMMHARRNQRRQQTVTIIMGLLATLSAIGVGMLNFFCTS